MVERPYYRLVLAKEDFKFSVAHFTVFSAEDAELLHGHNYRVRVELAGSELGELGLLADVAAVKAEIRRLCEEWDSRTLLPAESPHVTVRHDGDAVEATYARRTYRFPAADVVLLPLPNTTMELFARLLWHRLAPTFAGTPVTELAVSVEETDGQRGVYAAGLDD